VCDLAPVMSNNIIKCDFCPAEHQLPDGVSFVMERWLEHWGVTLCPDCADASRMVPIRYTIMPALLTNPIRIQL